MKNPQSIRPVGNRALILIENKPAKTESGILLPENQETEKITEGKIIAIGSGDRIKKLDIKKGDKISFNKYSGLDYKVGMINYKLLEDDEILAVLE